MSKDKRIKNIFLLGVIFLFTTFSFPAIAAPSTEIDMVVTAGYDDTVKIGYTVPFYVTLKNKGDEVSGELQIILNNNPDTRSVYAMPFSLPKGSDKELVIQIPVYTIDRKIDIKLVKGGKTLKETEYAFKKFISPDTPVVGILSDDPNSVKGLNGLSVSDSSFSSTSQEMAMRMKVMIAAGEAVASSNKIAEAIHLNATNMPEDVNSMNAFDILVLSNFDTSALSEKQKGALESWVSGGKMLLAGTGPNWKKIYGGLPESLKPFQVEGTKTLFSFGGIGKFTGKQSPSGTASVAIGNAGQGAVAASEEGVPLVVHYRLGNGFVSFLAFDPSLSPISNWDEVENFWKTLINSVTTFRDGFGAASYLNNLPNGAYMNVNYLTSNVPETQTPPYRFLLILIGVYIVIVGPLLYLLLKWRDKRDWSWMVIPGMAFLFMGIIYVVGFKTRFDTAVLNNISIINISPGLDKYTVHTSMGAFNNERGSMKLQYDNTSNIDINSNNQMMYGYYSSSYPNNNDEARISSKLTLSNPRIFEMYDTRLWQPIYVNANKTLKASGEVLNTVSMVDGNFKTVIKNTTGFALKEAFISVGNNFIEVGDLEPSEEKTIEALLGSTDVYMRLDGFLNKRYGQGYNTPPKDRTKEWVENNRKRNILQNLYNVINTSNNNQAKILLLAFNYDDPAYDIIINDEKPKTYNTNVVYSAMNMNFEKNTKVTIPHGIIQAVFNQGTGKYAHFEDPEQGGIRVMEDSDVDFNILLPVNITPEKLKIIWENVIPNYIKYQSPQAQKQVYGKNTHKYMIYNNTTSTWEEISSGHVIEKNASYYVNNNGEIKLRANVTVDKSANPGELLGTPDLEISGVVN